MHMHSFGFVKNVVHLAEEVRVEIVRLHDYDIFRTKAKNRQVG